jgi:hypothetical protein
MVSLGQIYFTLGVILKSFIYILGIILFTFNSCGSGGSGNSPILNYDIPEDATIYEDAEDGSIERWEVQQGHPVQNVKIGSNGSERSIYLRENWLRDENDNYILSEDGYPTNGAHYEIAMHNDNQFILEFDKMKKHDKIKYCFTVGVKLLTDYGTRYISFNPFYDKEGMDARAQWLLDGTVRELNFPLSMSYVKVTNVWKHLRFNLSDYLHQFEPDNHIISVNAFYFEGGNDYLDNILLTSE